MLLVSELVTNVIVHTSSDVELHLSRFDGHVRVEVSDRAERHVKIRDSDAAGGAVDSSSRRSRQRWGVDARQDGKTVWFEVGASTLADRL